LRVEPRLLGGGDGRGRVKDDRHNRHGQQVLQAQRRQQVDSSRVQVWTLLVPLPTQRLRFRLVTTGGRKSAPSSHWPRSKAIRVFQRRNGTSGPK